MRRGCAILRRRAAPRTTCWSGTGWGRLRAAGAEQVGVALDLHPVRVLGDSRPEELQTARLITGAMVNGIYLESVLHGRYPAQAPAGLLPPPELVADGDMELISQRLDFLGVHYYSPH